MFAFLLWMIPGFLEARTITLTMKDCDLFASLSSEMPTHGLAGTARSQMMDTDGFKVSGKSAILIRFKLDRIPKDQRIIRAELLVPLASGITANRNAGLMLWRLTQPWGVGVSHQLRQARPEVTRWAEAGARGVGSDRALAPSAQIRITSESGEIALNVLNDVDLWYSGSAKDYGWMLCTEDAGDGVALQYPLTAPDQWKLRITYEP